MSVRVAERKESRLEAIVFSEELHDMMIDLMQRNFGIRDPEQNARDRYARGKDPHEDFSRYNYLMKNFKTRMDRDAALITAHLLAANAIYPTTLDEYSKRREFQDLALAACAQLMGELRRVVEVFDVDLNIYGRYVRAINREIDLIKRWRQRDNRFKSLPG